MALLPCPECQRDISEKAESCPHCGAEWAGTCPECSSFRPPLSEKCKNCGFPFSSGTRIKERARTLAVSGDGLGKRWFVFWTYVCYPVSIAIALLFAIASGKPYFWFLFSFLIFIVIGLHKRRLWAYHLNFVVILANYGTLFLPAIRESIPIETWAFQLLIGAAFVIANAYYWQKREQWFSDPPMNDVDKAHADALERSNAKIEELRRAQRWHSK